MTKKSEDPSAAATASLEVGSLVWVKASKKGGSFYLPSDEVGQIVDVDCPYYDLDSGVAKKDGLLVKLKISNVRTVFPKDRVFPLDDKKMKSEGNASSTEVGKRSSRRRVPKGSRIKEEKPFLYPLGTKVRKHFPGHGGFTGNVIASGIDEDDKVPLYKVEYEDGDMEDVYHEELCKIIVETSDDDEDMKITPVVTSKRRRGSARSVITPAVTSRRSTVTPDADVTANVSSIKHETSDSDDEEADEFQKTSKTKAVVKGKDKLAAASPAKPKTSKHFTPVKAGKKVKIESDSDSEWDRPLASFKRKPAARKPADGKDSKKSKTVAKKLTAGKTSKTSTLESDSDLEFEMPLSAFKRKPVGKKAAGKKASRTSGKNGKATKKIDARSEDPCDSDSSASNQAPSDMIVEPETETDSDAEKDRPYKAEYAATSRAVCKSCDERIEKGAVRIGSTPLFRGKPGFVVFRHLHCQVLPEEITNMKDVGGWRKLKPDDRVLLQNRIEESKLIIEQENEELDANELVQAGFEGEMRQPPSGLSATLLPFQQEGVSWMYNQEVNEEVKGGILADEMGMGKTIQTITTILDNRPKLQHSQPGAKHPPSAQDLESLKKEEKTWNEVLKSCHYALKMADVPEGALKVKKKKGAAPVGVRAGTLVVCPVIALYQWKEEIDKFTEENALSVCIYHGNDRQAKFPREILCKYDIILTTYQVIEADFRKMVSPNKVTCPNCKRSFKIDKLSVHLKYFCGASAQRTEAQSRQHRTADRRGRNGGGGPKRGGERKVKGGGKTKKPPLKNKPSKQIPTKMKTSKVVKKTVRASAGKGYDTDSDLSVPEDLDILSKRPSRSAAKTAKKRLADSSKQWGDGFSSADSDSFSDDAESSDDSKVGNSAPESKKGGKFLDEDDDYPSEESKSLSEDCESDSEDDSMIERARKRQRVAFSQLKGSKKKDMPAKKIFKESGVAKKKAFNKKRPFFDKGVSESSGDDHFDRDDPLDGVDLEALKKEAMDGCRASVLHTMCFWRIVLDEAHMIKSRQSQTASAAFHLSAVHRWALSGTPLQNRVGELYSLIRFLRIDPMAHYFCKRDGCDCKSIFYRMEHGKCKDCGHGSVQHFSHFNKHILNVIQREGYSGDGRRAMLKLKAQVLDKSLLRRTKESRAEDMNLPSRVVTIKPIRLHPREEDFYNALYTQTKSSFDDYVAEGTLLNNYAHIFDLLTKMRQAVDHPYLIVHSKKQHAVTQIQSRQNGLAVANGSTECEICEETPTDRVVSSCCGTAYCRSCVMELLSLENMLQGNSVMCRSCRNPLSIDLNQKSQEMVDDSILTVKNNGKSGVPSLKELSHVASGSILRRIDLGEFATSTKIEALVQELVEMRQTRQGSKALVFSQFVNMLDLVRWRLHSDPCLQDLGLGVRIIHGGMNVQSRDEALKDFRGDPSVRVLLMSLKAGGVALNLTVASEAYLLDPWWNPAAEMQAIDRTHRLGQYRTIRAVRFIAEGTVEERVLQLQEKKRLVFDGTVGRDAASLKMLTVDDMKSLFT